MRTMYRFKLLFLLIVACLSTMTVDAQEVTSHANLVDSVEALNASCPIFYGSDWGINSITMVGNNYSLVDIGVPASLSMVLNTLTQNSDNVKQMWIKQLESFGVQWKHLVNLMVENNCRIIVNFRPKESEETALVTFLPTDFQK